MEIDIKSFHRALAQIAQERGIPAEKIIETLESAIATAYKKDYGQKGQKIKAKFNPVSGEVKFWQVKLVVDKDMLYTEEEIEQLKEKKEIVFVESAEHEEGKKVVFNAEKHIMVEDAKKDKSLSADRQAKLKAGDELEIPLAPKTDYGRIAAQTAKQVILQKIREVEKEIVLSEYKSKEGEITSGIVQRIEGHSVLVDIGKTLGVLNREEQIPGEFYRPGQRLKFYILKVDETPRGPAVILSRAYPKLISKLFELEVPEIPAGIVVIKGIAREPGFRTKIAVASTAEGIDPIGSCVGQRGTRIMAVINELGGEKIDVVEWSDSPEKLITNALAPAKIVEVKIDAKNTAKVFVPGDQLSLAIGKDGRNVRLAANLTGWKIDIEGVSTEAVAPASVIGTSEPEASATEADKEKPVVASASAKASADKKAKTGKAKKTKKTKAKKIGTDGEAVEETPSEVDAEAEEKPMLNSTEESPAEEKSE